MTCRPLSRDSLRTLAATQSGTTLVEVLSAIFIMGIGLLAIVALFPIGALDMAQAIDDDRADAIAAQAAAFAQDAQEVVLRTGHFVQESVAKGSVDPNRAAELRVDYESLGKQASGIERQLEDLQSVLPPPRVKRHTGPLLGQIRAFQRRIIPLLKLLSRFERGPVPD